MSYRFVATRKVLVDGVEHELSVGSNLGMEIALHFLRREIREVHKASEERHRKQVEESEVG